MISGEQWVADSKLTPDKFEREASGAPGGLRSARLANTLKDEIAEGRHLIGSVLPTEVELCARFGVSRYTVREALRRLSELGLISSRQGSGTRVLSLTPKSAYVHTLQSLSEIFQYTRDTRLDIQSMQMEPLTEEEAERVPAPVDSRWVKIVGVRRTVDAEPIAFSIIYVHGRFSSAIADLRSQTGPIYSHIEKRTGEIVMEARQIITSGAMPQIAAAALKTKPGAPAIYVLRRYLDVSGGPMLTAANWHPADRFTYAVTLRRDTAE
jgi:GntR family transcriptional regulator